MTRLLQLFALPLLMMNDYSFNYSSQFIPNYSGSGHNHRTTSSCINNRITNNRKRNKISRESRKNNF